MAWASVTRVSYEENSEFVAVATGAGAMAETLAPGVRFELKEVRLHFNGAGTTASEEFTITEDASEGAAYDVVHFAYDMETASDVVQTYYNKEKHFGASDELDFAYTNTAVVTWGLKVIYKLL